MLHLLNPWEVWHVRYNQCQEDVNLAVRILLQICAFHWPQAYHYALPRLQARILGKRDLCFSL